MSTATATEVKEHPIPFAAELVRATRDGRKTQHRIPVRPQPFESEHEAGVWLQSSGRSTYDTNVRRREVVDRQSGKVLENAEFKMPVAEWLLERSRWKLGDRLWVKETWYESGHHYASYPEDDEYKAWGGHGRFSKGENVFYAADGEPATRGKNEWGRPSGPANGRRFIPDKGKDYWRKFASIHMPRWASRLTLDITAVRVERLQEISNADLLAEGIVPLLTKADAPDYTDAVLKYQALWDKLNGKGSWDANPFVWVIEFRVAGGLS